MSVRFNVILSDDLNRQIDNVVEESESSKADVLRKALQLYLAARDGRREGLKIGLVDPRTKELKTEFIGL
jgi:predicted transcriptional regulator